MLAHFLDGFFTVQGQWAWLGDLHNVLPRAAASMLSIAVAVICGIVVGAERERLDKPAGMRTMTLICLGAAIFTQASILLGPPNGDHARIAAQVVTGVGFLGAGAILHFRGMVVGVTTGAAIWVVAAIGVVVGSGYVVAGMVFTGVVLSTLLSLRGLERWIHGPCDANHLTVRCMADGGKTAAIIECIIDDFEAKILNRELALDKASVVLSICFCRRHRHHRALLENLANLPGVMDMSEPAA